MPWDLRHVLLVLLVLLTTSQANALAQQDLRAITMESGFLNPKVPLAEAAAQGIVKFTLKMKLDAKGEGQGELILDPNSAMYNEVGDWVLATELALIKKPCSVKFIKKAKVKAGQGVEQEWLVFHIDAKGIMAQLHLVTPSVEMHHGRLVIAKQDGKVTSVVQMQGPPELFPIPCHPGCFPAGTLVATPKGAKAIDTLGIGAAVTIIRADGTTLPGKVQKVFITDNVLWKVQTDDGFLLTTQTQPLCLADGTPCAAGELQAGDRILRWLNNKVKAVKVLSVMSTGRKAKVFNLILGDSEMFSANGYLARSKPPAVAAAGAAALRVGLPAGKK